MKIRNGVDEETARFKTEYRGKTYYFAVKCARRGSRRTRRSSLSKVEMKNL